YSIINGYGLTEAPLVMVNTPENGAQKPGSIGKPVMFMDICIFDDNFEEVEVGEIGELGVRGNNITPGYWNKPEETAKTFHGEYFLTGDLAKVDEDGDVYIVDRRKEMIITGGENVLPSEVETVLAEHPLVAQGVVVGYDSPKYGESVAAAVVLTEDDPDFEAKLDAHMRENIAGYKIPRLYLKLTHMPLNSTSKADKLELQKYMNEKAQDRKSTRLNSSHVSISYAVFCLKKKKTIKNNIQHTHSTCSSLYHHLHHLDLHSFPTRRSSDLDFEAKLDAHMRENIAGYKIPRLYLKLTHMPLNSTSKADKLELQKYMNEKAQQEDKGVDDLI